MLDALYIMIPVAIHQVCHQTTCSLWQIIGILLDDFIEIDAMQQNHFLTIGREHESLDIFCGLWYLLTVWAVRIHSPDLTAGEESNLSIQPCGVSLALCASGERCVACAIGIDDCNFLLALIGFHAIITYLIDNLLAVGTRLTCTDTSHSPERFWGHQITGELDILFSDLHVVLSFRAAAETYHQRNSNYH